MFVVVVTVIVIVTLGNLLTYCSIAMGRTFTSVFPIICTFHKKPRKTADIFQCKSGRNDRVNNEFAVTAL